MADAGGAIARYCTRRGADAPRWTDTLDAQILQDAQATFFEVGEKMQLYLHGRNTHRAIGTRTFSSMHHPPLRHAPICSPGT